MKANTKTKENTMTDAEENRIYSEGGLLARKWYEMALRVPGPALAQVTIDVDPTDPIHKVAVWDLRECCLRTDRHRCHYPSPPFTTVETDKYQFTVCAWMPSVPVTQDTVIKRLNRKLTKRDEKLLVSRGLSMRQNVGAYYIVKNNIVTNSHINLEAFGRELGVMQIWETVEV